MRGKCKYRITFRRCFKSNSLVHSSSEAKYFCFARFRWRNIQLFTALFCQTQKCTSVKHMSVLFSIEFICVLGVCLSAWETQTNPRKKFSKQFQSNLVNYIFNARHTIICNGTLWIWIDVYVFLEMDGIYLWVLKVALDGFFLNEQTTVYLIEVYLSYAPHSLIHLKYVVSFQANDINNI